MRLNEIKLYLKKHENEVMKAKFLNDWARLYEIVAMRQKELGDYFGLVEHEAFDVDVATLIDTFLEEVELAQTRDNRVAALTRLINLRDDQLVQALEKEGKDAVFIAQAKEKAYLWVKAFYMKRHAALIETVEQEALFSPFYRRILQGVHEIGVAMSEWQSQWNEHIVNTINPLLELEYERDGQKIAAMLHEKGLFDPDPCGEEGDRSYSVLQKVENGYIAQAYATAFPREVASVRAAIGSLVEDLNTLDDTVWGQKEAYVRYFQALNQAFGEEDRTQLIAKWADVDRTWMDMTAPIQIGHPLEYYEDHYKKAVALEWDVRLSRPEHQSAATTYARIEQAFVRLYDALGSTQTHLRENVLSNLKRVQLYIGRPALFYAAEFNGLFSAQVVPNDETVSKERGKKIFAFADNVLDAQRAKPFLKIHHEVFGKAFIDEERDILFHRPDLWHRIYEVGTIGHEYGHILWMDEGTETRMNRSGVFKNIEEFKATTGGLVAFFMHEDAALKRALLSDTIKRSVGLIAWMKTSEVEPYYCEGLIHLSGLFESGVLRFDETLSIDQSDAAYEKLKSWYLQTYTDLAKHYLAQNDAKIFLDRFASQNAEGLYMPCRTDVKRFVEYYWHLHQTIGRQIDEQSKRSDWL